MDVVYISSPHPMHAEHAIAAAEAGKHILCEKPAALNTADARVVLEAARRNGVFFMEAFIYRCHPRTSQITDLVRSSIIGKVTVLRGSFSFAAHFNAEIRLF